MSPVKNMPLENIIRRRCLFGTLLVFNIFLALTGLANPSFASEDFSDLVTEQIRVTLSSETHVESSTRTDRLSIFRDPNEREFLKAIYSLAEYQALWQDSAEARRLISLIEKAPADGLDARDYHLVKLKQLAAISRPTPADMATLDILLTDAFARFAYHLRFGKSNPYELDPKWNFSREFITDNPIKWLKQAIDTKQVEVALSWLRPRIPSYRALAKSLAYFETVSKTRPWGRMRPGETLKPGMADSRIRELRDRLIAGGYLDHDSKTESDYFDDPLEMSVRRFQRDHGLDVDGAVGKQTILEMNVPIEDRINQLRVNLERIRWLFRDIGKDFVLVNIAAFQAMYVADGRLAWKAKAIVGKPYRQTPSFKATMTHLIFNPTWTVPPTIWKNDILPAVKKDQAYLGEKNIRVLDYSGNEINPNIIDWSNIHANNFPYVLRQDSGIDNALGRVKFMFPNSHSVYLHDTPGKTLFARTERTFSSGCIRVDRPFELASALLNHNLSWTPVNLNRILESGRTRRIDLDRPVSVLLVYLTAFVADDGSTQFRRDIYKRDNAVFTKLLAPFKFSPPKGYSLASPP